MQQKNYDIAAVMETWWDDSQTGVLQWMAINSSERIGKEGEAVGYSCVRECFDCLELDDGDDRVECLWVRTRKKANKADITVEVCYRPLNHDEEADEIFYK